MEPYTIQLENGTEAFIYQKREGRKRSVRLLFFKIRRRKKLIAYTLVNKGSSTVYTIYKTKTGGKWLRKGEKAEGRFTKKDANITSAIEKAIDQYEGKIGMEAYKALF